eukprot:TRINITY_DN99144_c0_g1_i1.p1 TRINITY_DN99144_c0_g1~~TRINITY_DN99144_c0_g1_i1.p1  ORF type:complete len:287 (+),score=32.62 TRINITY_DN99144_c0_g1_i1:57-917(+)
MGCSSSVSKYFASFDCSTSCPITTTKICPAFWVLLDRHLPRREDSKAFPRMPQGCHIRETIEAYLHSFKEGELEPGVLVAPKLAAGAEGLSVGEESRYSLECYKLVNVFHTLSQAPDKREFQALCEKLQAIQNDPLRFRAFTVKGLSEFRHAHMNANIILFFIPRDVPHLISVEFYGPATLLTTATALPPEEKLVEVVDAMDIESVDTISTSLTNFSSNPTPVNSFRRRGSERVKASPANTEHTHSLGHIDRKGSRSPPREARDTRVESFTTSHEPMSPFGSDSVS